MFHQAQKLRSGQWYVILAHNRTLFTLLTSVASQDEWLDMLSRFSHLETLGSSDIWEHVHAGTISQEELIRKLLVACPDLRYLNNHDTKRKGDHRLHIHPISPNGSGPNGEVGDDIQVVLYRIEILRPM